MPTIEQLFDPSFVLEKPLRGREPNEAHEPRGESARAIQAEMFTTQVTCACGQSWLETRDLLIRMERGKDQFYAAPEKTRGLLTAELPRRIIHTMEQLAECGHCFGK